MYYEYKEQVKYIKPHRILAINRAEKEKVISVSIDYDIDRVINYLENKVIKNNNSFVVDIYKSMAKMSIDDLLTYIDKTLAQEGLSITNKDAYVKFRDKYNKAPNKNPIDLYILICYAFNYQCRFNNSHEFNSPFGITSFQSILKAFPSVIFVYDFKGKKSKFICKIFSVSFII